LEESMDKRDIADPDAGGRRSIADLAIRPDCAYITLKFLII